MTETPEKSGITFDQKRAENYDRQREKTAAMKEALHLCLRFSLTDLDDNARVLMVGIGTGAELLYLAKAFPNWQFTAVDPAAPMLQICRDKAAQAGISERCTFHEGTLETLPKSEAFDAATAILVSHFMTEESDRSDFFKDISTRLKKGAPLVNADLSADMTAASFVDLEHYWLQMLNFMGLPAEKIKEFREAFGKDVTLIPSGEMQSLLLKSAFKEPLQIFQTLLIHAWISKAAS